MALDVGSIRDRVLSLAARTGAFDSIEGYEPPSAPGLGIRGALWVERIIPVASGLDVVSVGVIFKLRISKDLPGAKVDLERVDPDITDAANAALNALAVDFTLGSTTRQVDIHGGETGVPLDTDAGYFEQDGHKYRALIITIPVVVDDVWTIGGS